MKPGTIVILSVIFMLLTLYVHFFETGPQEAVETVPAPEKIVTVDPGDVVEIRLKTESNQLVFQKRGQQWEMVSPIQDKVRNSRVETLFSVFDYGIINEVAADSMKLDLYGLDAPEIEFGFRVRKSQEFTTLQIGDNTPYGVNCYAKLKGSSRVLVVGLLYKQVLNQDVKFFQPGLKDS